MKKYDVVVVGSINVDLTTETPRLPRAGQTVLGRRSHLSFGGASSTTCAAAACAPAR